MSRVFPLMIVLLVIHASARYLLADAVGVAALENTSPPAAENGLVTCQISIQFDDLNNSLYSISEANVGTTDPLGFFQAAGGTDFPPLDDAVRLEPIMIADSFVTIGLSVVPSGLGECTTLLPSFDSAAFNNDGQVLGGWFCNNPPAGQGLPDDDGLTLALQLTVRAGFEITGSIDATWLPGLETRQFVFSCFSETPCALADDGLNCTVDECDPVTGLVVHVTDDLACNDGNTCTVDICDADVGCINDADAGDLQLCDIEGEAGLCKAGECVVLKDGQPCTALDSAKVAAMDADPGDGYGFAVDLDGDTAVSGAFCDDEGGDCAGAAYVHMLLGDQWVQSDKLTASDADTLDQFGSSIGLAGNVLVVGARNAALKGSQMRPGAAYVLRYDGRVWIEEQKLAPLDGADNDQFGESVAIDGDVVLVGAMRHDSAGSNAGAAYLYRFAEGVWELEDKLTASDADPSDRFGESVSISGNVVAVASRNDDDAESNAGAIYVFRFDGQDWNEEAKLTATEAGADDTMTAVSIDGDYILAGAEGANGNTGAAYVFAFDGNQWIEQAMLSTSDAGTGSFFGGSVALDEGVAVVGAREATFSFNDSAGSAYVWRREGNQWLPSATLRASDAASNDLLGFAVAVNTGRAFVGAIHDDDNCPEEQPDCNSGSAYIYYGLTNCNNNSNLDACDSILGLQGYPNDPLGACPCVGDVDSDGTVNATDIALLLGAWGQNLSDPADLNGDGFVNAADLAQLLGNWGHCS